VLDTQLLLSAHIPGAFNLVESRHLDQVRGCLPLDLRKDFLCELDVQLFVRLRVSRPKVELEPVELLRRHEFCGNHKCVSVKFLARAELVIEAVRHILEAGFHGARQSPDNEAVQVGVVVFDDCGRTAACARHICDQFLVAAFSQPKAEDPDHVAMHFRLGNHLLLVVDLAIGEQENSLLEP